MIYKFNNVELDTEKFTILASGKKISVEPQVFNLILFLIENSNKIVSREELLDHVWQGRVVSDTSINNNIKTARKVLGDNGSSQQVIKTIHSRGYQFVAEVNSTGSSTNSSQSNRVYYYLFITIAILILALVYLGFNSQLKTAPSISQSNIQNSIENEGKKAPPKVQKLIAVLPFANTKPSPDTDYLGFALSSQIISDMNYLEEYAIVPAAAIRKYTEAEIDTSVVAKELAVDYIISGNYLLENNTVRLNLEMIEINNNQLLWREAMHVDFSDTFSLQDIVVQKVAKRLDAGFRKSYQNQLHRNIPNSALAYEYYLRGISYPPSNEGHKMAVEMLLKSIALDPEYAPSYAHLGFHRRLLEQHGRVIPTGMNDAQWYYQKALAINPLQLDALSNLSALYAETNRIEDAVMLTRRMLEINPDDANSHFALGYIYRYAGMVDEAIMAMENALAISPNNSRFRSIIATYISAGKYEDALAKVYLDPGDYGTGYSGMIAFEQKQYDLARERFTKVIEIDQYGIWGLIAQIYLSIMDDEKEKGLAALSQMVDSNITDAENMYYFANFYALLDEKEQCLDWLEKAVEMGYFNYPHISKNNHFSFIKYEPRYISIIEKAKQRHEAFRKQFL
jgi:DNA-binding winged helix-turn-helix (wHTH) protein/TolB-like protein